MRLEWSPFALADRDAIFDYIVADRPPAAVSVDDRIKERVERLIRFPQSGRPGRIQGTRELVIAGTPYVAAYLVDGEIIRILRVLHGGQTLAGRPGSVINRQLNALGHKRISSIQRMFVIPA